MYKKVPKVPLLFLLPTTASQARFSFSLRRDTVQQRILGQFPTSPLLPRKPSHKIRNAQKGQQTRNQIQQRDTQPRLRQRNRKRPLGQALNLLDEGSESPIVVAKSLLEVPLALGDLARQHVGPYEGARGAHARHGRGAVRGVGQEHHAALVPRVGAHLDDLLRVKVVGRLHPLYESGRHPSRVFELGRPKLHLLLDRSSGHAPHLVRVVPQREEGLAVHRILRPRHDEAAPWEMMHLANLIVRSHGRNAPVRHVHPQMPQRIGGSLRQNRLPDPRPLTLRPDQHVVPPTPSIREPDSNPPIILLKALHTLAKNILHIPPRSLVQNPHKIPPHDLKLGRKSLRSFTALVSQKRGSRFPVRAYKGHALLVDDFAADGGDEAHALGDLDPLGPQVDLGAVGAQRGEALDDCDAVACAGEPEGQGGAGAAAAADEDV